MLPGKPKHKCIYTTYNVCCDKDAAEGNKYCAEHIEPQCARKTLPLGRKCKNKVYVPREIHCKQCMKEEEEYKEEIISEREIERIKRNNKKPLISIHLK